MTGCRKDVQSTFHRIYAAVKMQAAFPAATVAVQGNVIREGAAVPRKAASAEDGRARQKFHGLLSLQP